ncbi:hypothetical protein [Celeribacter ethanolicus]|uniref:Pilus assembly protein n=1 Tax=Celeribacter ethanolicus TaxID=1758178 RepID=A0A291GAY5_9RHOB|nr:hypothetical protein [Celeribacter ethanolicus]ATG47559.1 hypothetical protein CEW89_08220 [Celeribacter ethanolicus]TNE64446.1 MAG: hypothetical protein EP336_15270 [Paracoccaceae bacterium]
MIDRFKHFCALFRADDEGAVTVDWVVLVSAIVGMSIMVLSIIWQGAFTFSMRLNSEVESMDVVNYTDASEDNSSAENAAEDNTAEQSSSASF